MTFNPPHIFRTDWGFDIDWNFEVIRDEVLSSLEDIKDYIFIPSFNDFWLKETVLADPEKYPFEYASLKNMEKGVRQLYFVGEYLEERTGNFFSPILEEKLPNFYKVLKSIPKLRSAQLNILAPDTHIQPHIGPQKGYLKGHIVLKAEDNCKLFVKGEDAHPYILEQKTGDIYFFDDTPLHWAGNAGSDMRHIVILDFYPNEAQEYKPLENWTEAKHGGPSKNYSY